MKGKKPIMGGESFYHQPTPIRMAPRGSSNRGRGSGGGKAGGTNKSRRG
jgi:hypothetical protein